MPAAIAIPAIIGAGTSVATAAISANAAGKAAKTQRQGADRAQAFNERVYGEQRELMRPYVQAGQESMGRLMSQHWGTPYSGPNGPTVTAPNPYAPTPQALGIPNGQPRLGASMQGFNGGSGTVVVEAPTGERRVMPLALAQQAQAKGARILGAQ